MSFLPGFFVGGGGLGNHYSDIHKHKIPDWRRHEFCVRRSKRKSSKNDNLLNLE